MGWNHRERPQSSLVGEAPDRKYLNHAMPKDWRDWHRHYDNPNSSIALRLEVVQRDLRRALAESPKGDGITQLITMCAGEGRDVFGQKVGLAKAASGVSPPTTLAGALFDW